MKQSTQDIVKYCDCMQEIKARLNLLETILAGTMAIENDKLFSEVSAVNLRKILELIAFGSLIANKEQYSQAHKNFESHWKAVDMLKYLEKVNLEFYPAPVKVESINQNGVKHLNFIKSNFLSKEQFVSLYDICSGILHTRNPFSLKKAQRLNATDVRKWVSLIQKLLAFHRARLFGTSEGWLVVMQHESDGKVHAFAFNALPSQP